MHVGSMRRLNLTARPARRAALAIAAAGTVFMGNAPPAAAQSAENVAVVINDRSPDSRAIGEYYVARRGVPAANVLHIEAALDEEIDRATFTDSIERPIRTLISVRRLHDRVLYLLLTTDIPLRIKGTPGPLGTAATVDSELTLLYRSMVGTHVGVPGTVSNPYYAGDSDLRETQPFTHRTQDIFLVSRLDGPSVKDVLALIDRGLAPASNGVFRLVPTSGQNESVAAAAARIAAQLGKERVSLETDTSNQPDRRWLGYYGGLIPEGIETPFAAGSIAAFGSQVPTVLHRTRSEGSVPPAQSGRKPVPRTVDDLLRDGLTGVVAGVVPSGAAIRPDILFPAYLAGASIVEAAYLSMASLSGNTVVIGDPLCAPFRQKTLSGAEIEAKPDPITDLPGVFSKRRVAEIASSVPFVPPSAIALTLGADALNQRGDPVGRRARLEEAVAIAPDFAFAQFTLATLDDEEGRYDSAIARYRLALDAEPPHARDIRWETVGYVGAGRVRTGALNNLAYALAVHRKAPHEALPLAQRAVAESPQDPQVLDTLAWVEYLDGDIINALVHIRASLAIATSSESVLLHAAVILAANDQCDEAQLRLDEVLRRRPDLVTSDQVTRVQAQLRNAVGKEQAR